MNELTDNKGRMCAYMDCECFADVCDEGCKVYEYRHSDLSDREKCLKWICEEDASICLHPNVFPCTFCSQITGISVRKVRSIMRQLESEGFVKKSYEGGYNDWTDHIICIHGYAVTEKGRTTKYWIEAYKKEREYIENSLKSFYESNQGVEDNDERRSNPADD